MRQIVVKVADAAVACREATISTIGLGSCVAIMLYEPVARIGALAHVLLPTERLSQDRDNRAKFPGTAVPMLLEQMRAAGAHSARITARLAGGASMFPGMVTAGLQIGERNVQASRQALARAGVPIIAEDIGGAHGRTIVFRIADGRITVRSLVRGDVEL
ncbi:MAG: chemotaxis protein CheD [Gemmatimonadota bacterium]|nr:chemotaxis protein CheD [Gemmatimonadota bacterium]